MDSWMTPKDSPIWCSLNESYAHLDLETKKQAFQLLQEAGIPPTDKIYPWVVETIINRVSMARLEEQLHSVSQGLSGLPDQISQAVEQAVASPVQAIQSNQSTVEGLTFELRKNSVIESSLRQSGWRGIVCSLEAIAQHKMLGLTVGAIALLGMLASGLIVWGVGKGDRQIIQFNRQTIENCYEKFAVDQDGNDWFSCSGIQLPIR